MPAAAKKPSSSAALARLTPNSIDVKIDGHDVRVATSKAENAIMNMIMASQMRSLLQQQVKKYQDDEVKFTPKELADLARAAKDIASFSGEIYAGSEPIETPGEKEAEKPSGGDVDFENPIDVETK